MKKRVMKKLMIAAATTAIVGGVFGGTAQVYDMTVTVKVTDCAKGKYKNVCGDGLMYRAQKTKKFYGKFWGCGCEVIACPDQPNYGRDGIVDQASQSDHYENNSYIFWTDKAAFRDASMSWTLLQLVGKKATNIEGKFDLGLYLNEDSVNNSQPDFNLTGAGYGTASVTVDGCDPSNSDCSNYIKSMSGNVVGTYNVTSLSEAFGCTYCGDTASCTPWDFCLDNCSGLLDANLSAAFGSFTIKYNASQTKKISSDGKKITDVNKFKPFVKDMFDTIAAAGTTPEVKPSDNALAAYKDAQKAYVDATNALEAAYLAFEDLDKGPTLCKQGQALDKAATDAADAVKVAKSAQKTANDAYKAFNKAPLKDVYKAQGEVAAAEAALVKAEKDLENAKNQTDVKNAKDAIETATTDIANAKIGLENAKKGIDQKELDEFTAAYDKKVAADKAVKEAEEAEKAAKDAVTDWAVTGHSKAHDDAEEAVENAEDARDDAKMALEIAKLGCTLSGADCK